MKALNIPKYQLNLSREVADSLLFHIRMRDMGMPVMHSIILRTYKSLTSTFERDAITSPENSLMHQEAPYLFSYVPLYIVFVEIPYHDEYDNKQRENRKPS